MQNLSNAIIEVDWLLIIGVFAILSGVTALLSLFGAI